jgi:hypothetical protein
MSYRPFTAIMERYFKRNGGWTRLQGELAAVRYQDGSLFLRTENPALAHQVSLMSLEIIKRFQRLLGKRVITSIKIRIAPLSNPAKPAPPPKAAQSLSADEEKFIQECGQEIADPELEARFALVMRKHLTNVKQKQAELPGKCKRCGVPVEADYDLCSCCQFHQAVLR